MKNFTLPLMALLFFSFGTESLQAQLVTKTVDDGTDGTLRKEIADTGSGGTITFDPSIQGQTINVTMGEIPINSFISFTINGDNNGTPTTIAGTNSNRIFNINSTVASAINFNDLTLINGTATDGGAVRVTGTTTILNLSDVSFTNNRATGTASSNGGGAILNSGSMINITGNSVYMGNTATAGSGSGGAILNSAGGTLRINGATFNGNSSSRAGGAIEDNANSGITNTISDSNFLNNDAGASPGNGGALHVSGSSSYTFTGGMIDSNIAGKEGGGLWNNQGVLTINGTTISNNEARGNFVAGSPPEIVGGGGIFAEDGNGSVIINEGTTISGNLATGTQGSGGGILMATGTTLTINGTVADPVVISNNRASRAGGGLEDWSLAANTNTLTNVQFTGNSAGISVGSFTANGEPGNGGAVHVTGSGSNSFIGGNVTNNTAANEGGGLWNGSGTMTVSGAAISGNTAAGSDTMVAGAAGGGGIYNEGGTLTLEQSAVVSNNSATGAQSTGGGILNAAGTFTATDSDISGNESNRAGGGIETNGASSVVLNNVTLNGNATGVVTGTGAPGNGGGLHVSGSGSVDVNGGTVNTNTAANEGGGLWNGSGTMTVSGAAVSGNTAAGSDTMVAGAAGGGGIYNEGGTLTLEQNAVVANNSATGAQSTGGGILNAAGTFTATDSDISGNESNRAGGGIETNGASTVVLNNVTLNANETGVVTGTGAPGNGGGLHVSGSGSVDVNGGTVNTNTAANEGGGLWNGSGTMTVSGVAVSENTAAGSDTMVAGAAGGGGIYNEGGTLTLEQNAVVSNNSATGAQSTGGGILNAAGSFTATDSDISGNESNRAGGGIETNGGSSIVLNNVTLNVNATGVVTGAGAPGNGGGLHVSGAAPVTITGGTVSDNTAAKEGGGLWNNQGVLTINGTTLSNNDAQGDFVAGTPPEIVGGGGIFAEDGNGSVIINEGTTISGNTATGTQGSGGGILMATGTTLTINGTVANPVTISDNRASRAGGGIEDWSLDANSNTLTNVNFTGNTAGLTVGTFTANGGPGNGGAIHVTGPGNNSITGGTADGNRAALEGGGLWNNLGTMTVIDMTLNNNTAAGGASADDGGGAIFNNGGDFNGNGLTITNNLATGTTGSGGAMLSLDGSIVIDNSTITGNSARRAGGAFELVNGSLNISNSNVSENDVNGTAGAVGPGNGGALHITGSSMVDISSSTFNDNAAAAEGGALWNQANSQIIVSNTTIDGNTANGTAADSGGGGIYANGGDTQVYDTTISNNIANGSNGGGITIQGGTLIVQTSTISSNTATLDGAGVYHAGTSADFDIVTVAQNTANGSGGGLYSAAGTFTIKNTLVAENTAAANVNVFGITSGGYNLIEIDDTGSFAATATDVEGTPSSPAFASLGPLQDNGGNTFTHELMNGTRAQDAGDPAVTLDDQRGEPVFGPARDIGSYEAQATLGTEDVAGILAGIRLYPNPSNNGFVNIDLPNSLTADASYQVMDMTGKRVASAPLKSGVNNVILDKLSTGIYIIRVNAGNQSQSLKFIRE